VRGGRGDGSCGVAGMPVARSRRPCGGSPEAALTVGTGDVTYLVLADRAVPYLLARVRWPDVAQALAAASPDWIDDPGLFDLPYSPNAVTVSFAQAASMAAGWGRQLSAEAAEGVPSFLRRMPANWSDLSSAERHSLGIGPVGGRRGSARRVRRLRSLQAKIPASSAAYADGRGGVLAAADEGAPAANGHGHRAGAMNGHGSMPAERRREMRMRVDGRAHIRSGRTTISAGLVDLSGGGVRCVLPDPPLALMADTTLDGPFVLEAEVATSRICLDVTGRISWHRGLGAGAHFGVAFGQLDDGETYGVQRFLAAARSRRGYQ
jgi:hypothetical protein